MALKTLLSSVLSLLLFLFSVLVVEVESGRHLPEKIPSGGRVQADKTSVHYEQGVVVKTVFDGNRPSMSIYRTAVFQDYVYALDSTYSEVLKFRLPIDQSKGAEMARRVAGDSRGRTGHIDGWSEDSLLNHPTGLAVDGDGNVYIADVGNKVIRKVTPAGYVSTLAGQSNVTGFADGEGQNVLFSSDFDLSYEPKTCELIISDRGNRRLRTIELKPAEKCSEQQELSSDDPWKPVSIVLGSLVTLLSAALGVERFQKWELLQSIISRPFQFYTEGRTFPNGYESLENLPNDGQRGSLSGDVAHHNSSTRPNLIDLGSDLSSEETSQDNEITGSTGYLENFAADSKGDRDSNASPSISSDTSEEEADRIDTTQRVRFRQPEYDQLSDAESILTAPIDSFSQHNGVDEEMIKNLHLFTQNSSK